MFPGTKPHSEDYSTTLQTSKWIFFFVRLYKITQIKHKVGIDTIHCMA